MRRVALLAFCLPFLSIAVQACSLSLVPPGTYPNCRKNPQGNAALDEIGWLCEGVVPDPLAELCGCMKNSTKHEAESVCGVGEMGAIIRYRRLHPDVVGDPVCTPIPMSPANDQQNYGSPECDACMAANCHAEAVACAGDPVCHCLDICQRGGTPVAACQCGAVSSAYEPFSACSHVVCEAACTAGAASGCPATCGP